MPKEGLLGSGSDGLGTSEKISKAARDARIPCIFNLISLSILCLYNNLIQSYIYNMFFLYAYICPDMQNEWHERDRPWIEKLWRCPVRKM